MKKLCSAILASMVAIVFFINCSNEPEGPDYEQRVFSKAYTLDSPFWDRKVKDIVTKFIPMTIDLMESDVSGWHSVNVFVQAGHKIKGEPYAMPIATLKDIHAWGDATVLNTMEAMCWALTIDPKGDQEIIDAQNYIRAKINTWVPLVEGAIKPDGYFSPQGTLFDYPYWKSPKENDLHEGYIFGYLLDCGIALYQVTDGKDQRLFKASRKTADLWCDSLRYDIPRDYQTYHPGVKQSLVRFGDFVESIEGQGTGSKYYELAQYLCDSRGVNGGEPYVMANQSILDAEDIYGHTVCAVYLLSGLHEVTRSIPKIASHDAAEAVAMFKEHEAQADKLWDILVNRKMYINGSCGSTGNEALSSDYDLPVYSYSETCASVANMLLQNNRNLLYPDARHHDILEVTLYNALLGAMDYEALNWCYCNPLSNVQGDIEWANWRRRNYQEDCCMNNFTRQLLQLPTFMYSKNSSSLRVNQYIGSTVNVGTVAGVDVTVKQETAYPDDGRIAINVMPARSVRMKLYLRIPNRTISDMYKPDIQVNGYNSLKVNGEELTPRMEDGYAVIERVWKDGDRVELELPMMVQKFRAVPEVEAVNGRIALQYGPFVFNVERVDVGCDPTQVVVDGSKPFKAVYDNDLMGGTWTICGTLSDGRPFRAIPNYARMNREIPGEYSVWLKEK